MKSWTIVYRFNHECEGEPAGTLFVGSGKGENKEEALANFRVWHTYKDMEIVSVEIYK